MSIGTVYGVGLGSGDVDLLSVRADRLVRNAKIIAYFRKACLLYTSPSPRDLSTSRMPSSA